MKKYIGIILMILVFILASCERDKIKEKEYDLTKDNVENFFDIEIKNENNKYSLLITPNNLLEVNDSDLTIIIYFEYYEKYTNHLYEEEIFAWLDSNTFKRDMTLDISKKAENITVFYYEITNASGNVLINDKRKITNYTYQLPNFEKVTLPVFEIRDPETNLLNYNELNNKFSNLMNQEHDYLTYNFNYEMKVKTTTNFQSSSTSVMMKLKEDYLELFADGNRVIYKNAYDRLFVYEINQSDYWGNKYHIDPKVLTDQELEDSKIEIEIEEDVYNYDVNKILFEKKSENHFRLQTLVKDIIKQNEYNELLDLYEELNLPKDTLESALVIVNYYIYEYTIEVQTILRLDFDVNNVEYVETVETHTFNFREFNEIDLTNESLYVLSYPDEFNEVVLDTNFLETTTTSGHPRPHYYYGYLEAGQYRFDEDDRYLEFDFFNPNESEVATKLLGKYQISNTYYIPKDGYYYLKVRSTLSSISSYHFKMIKEEYNYVYNGKNALEINEGSQSFNLEGERNYIILKYNSNTNAVAEISTNSENVLTLYKESYPHTDTTLLSNESGVRLLAIKKGLNEFIINADEIGSYQLNLNLINLNDNHYTTNYEEMMSLVEGEFSEFVFVSKFQSNANFKFTIAEKSIITFEKERYNNYTSSLSHAVYTEKGNYVGTFGSSENLIEAGNYFVALLPGYEVNASKIKFTTTVYGNLTYDVTLPEIEIIDRDDENLLSIEFYLYDLTNFAVINFSLNKTEIVYILGNRYEIIQNGEVVIENFTKEYSMYNGMYFELVAGDYQIEIKNDYDSKRIFNYKLAIISGDVNDDYIYGSNKHFINVNELLEFEIENIYDFEIFHFEITEADNYYLISSLSAVFFNSNFKRIYISQGTYNYLEVGTYTVLLTAQNYQVGNTHQFKIYNR